MLGLTGPIIDGVLLRFFEETRIQWSFRGSNAATINRIHFRNISYGSNLLTQGTPDFIHFHSVFNIYIGWWFGTCLFSIVYGIILPIDFHIFQDGSNHQPVYSKEDGDARKGRKVAIRCVFPMIWGFGGSKSRLAKARCGASWPEQRWKIARRCGAKHISKSKCTKHTLEMSKKCTPLWREAHFEVKMYKNTPGSDYFWKLRCRKVHASVARSTFRSQNVKNTRGSDHFGSCDVEKGHAVVARSTFRSENAQNTPARLLLEVKISKKCSALWREAHSKSKCTKHTMYEHFWRFRCLFRVAGARDCAACQKWANHEGFVAFRKTLASMGHLKIICKDAFFRGRGSTKDMCMREVGRSGRWFPERGCILEYQKCRFAKMILRDRCSTSYDLASIFRGQAQYFR